MEADLKMDVTRKRCLLLRAVEVQSTFVQKVTKCYLYFKAKLVKLRLQKVIVVFIPSPQIQQVYKKIEITIIAYYSA